jgi:hypothetical protein
VLHLKGDVEFIQICTKINRTLALKNILLTLILHKVYETKAKWGGHICLSVLLALIFHLRKYSADFNNIWYWRSTPDIGEIWGSHGGEYELIALMMETASISIIVGKILPDHTAQQPRRQPASYT